MPIGKNPPPIATTVARLFFPQSKSLRIDLGAESPGVLRKALYVISHGYSFSQGSVDLDNLAEVMLPAKQLERIAHRLGQERLDERDAEVATWKDLPLKEKFETPAGVVSPDLAVISSDGGRMQFRDAFAQPASTEKSGQPPDAEAATDSEAEPFCEKPPSKGKHYREDKIALLTTMDSEVSVTDPCPLIPPGFLDATRIPRLVRELKKTVSAREDAAGEAADPQAETAALQERPEYEPPEVQTRKVVATVKPWAQFAPMVATLAYLAGFQGAKRKAFVADGSANNWTLQKRYFGSFVAILDFIHALSYVFAAAMAGRPFEEGWACYQKWIGWVWEGGVGKVIEELQSRQGELGVPEADESETSPRSVVNRTLVYLGNQQEKMKYNEYRKEGLPITSSLMESTVKQINQRVKGTEKFWSDDGGEAILQLRADAISDEEVVEEFWERRQAAATGQRRYRRAS